MHHFEELFKERQVDGSMLVCLDEEVLESFGLDCSLMINRKGWGTERCDMERNYICKKGASITR